MAKTIQQYHDEIMASAQGALAQRFLKQITSGTTSRAEAQRLIYFGRYLTVVAWDFGEKQIALTQAPRSSPSEPERRALRDLNLAGMLPRRLSPTEIEALIQMLTLAEREWLACVKRHAETIRQENAAAQAARNDRYAAARAVAQALAVLAAAARQDGALYHDALADLTVEGSVLTGKAGPFKVTINVTVQ